ncbi:MAG: M23 family metallopeptidase [Pseudomonadota bacterium]
MKQRSLQNVTVKIQFLFYWLLSFSLFVLFLSGAAFAKEKESVLEVTWYPKPVGQGEICVIDVVTAEGVSSVTGTFQRRDLAFHEMKKGISFRTLIGIDLEAKSGTHRLLIFAKDSSGDTIESVHRIRVIKRHFGTQRLTLPREMVELDQKTLERVHEEEKTVKRVWMEERREKVWHGEFMKPLNGKVISSFGVRRFLNNLQRNPHSGIDLKASMGQEIRCSNRGIIALTGELYFSGKSVIVDHGQGLYTMYFHLSRIDVKEGQRVEKGGILGLAGSSGRVTGPHLHWGVRLHGARVDPYSLLRLK